VKIVVDEPIATPAEQARAALLDVAFYESLGALEGISPPEVREVTVHGGNTRLVLAYQFAGQLSGPARRILDPAKLSWRQVSETVGATGRTEVSMLPDNYAGLLSFNGWYEVRPGGRAACTQHFEGDLRVRVPLLGGLAERAIASSITDNIAATARLVERYVASREGSANPSGPERTGPDRTGPDLTGPDRTGRPGKGRPPREPTDG